MVVHGAAQGSEQVPVPPQSSPAEGYRAPPETHCSSRLEKAAEDNTAASPSKSFCSRLKECLDRLLAPLYRLWERIKRCFCPKTPPKPPTSPPTSNDNVQRDCKIALSAFKERVAGFPVTAALEQKDYAGIKEALKENPEQALLGFLVWGLSNPDPLRETFQELGPARNEVLSSLTQALFAVCGCRDSKEAKEKFPALGYYHLGLKTLPLNFFQHFLNALLKASAEPGFPGAIRPLVPAMREHLENHPL